LHPWSKAKTAAVKIAPAPPRAPGPGDLVDRLYADAVQALKTRDYASALDLLQLARSRGADDPRVLTAMGVIYDKLGRFDLSGRYYALAEAADPGSKVIAMDRAYSERLQRAGAEAAASMDGGAAARLARIETDRPVTSLSRIEAAETRPGSLADQALRLPNITLSAALDAGVRVRDATGQAGGADPIRMRLTRAGWSLDHVPRRASTPSAVSLIVYPGDYARVARALARTLPIATTLRPCDGCRRLEVVVGRDSLPKPLPAPPAPVGQG
jgi:tetratricopeptide (TPR) repeat protein